jgi:DNA-binding transcriptional LysR family regulator
MNKPLDLNLLRLFAEVHRLGSVSRAAEALGLTQPAASQGLARLRHQLKDPLFVRAPGGVKPTARANELAGTVRDTLQALGQAIDASVHFDPRSSRRLFRLHMSDIGEARFLPHLMAMLTREAPGVRLATLPLPPGHIGDALDNGEIDFAFGFLPQVKQTRQQVLLKDRYAVMLRDGHPALVAMQEASTRAARQRVLQGLGFVAVRSHADTLRILQHEGLEERLRLTTQNFMVLPTIVRETDLGAIMPQSIGQGLSREWGCTVVDPGFDRSEMTVSLHWSHRFEAEAGHRWFREQVTGLYRRR